MPKKQTIKQSKKPIKQAHKDESKAAPQTRGLIDGLLNDLHVADKSNLLGAMTKSKIDASKK